MKGNDGGAGARRVPCEQQKRKIEKSERWKEKGKGKERGLG
jgi:hypothetical protein